MDPELMGCGGLRIHCIGAGISEKSGGRNMIKVLLINYEEAVAIILLVAALALVGARLLNRSPSAPSGTTANLADETKVILESLTLTANGTKSGKLSIGSGNAVPNWADLSGNTSVAYGTDSFSATSTVNGKTGFNVTETATDLNSTKSPMIIPATVAAGNFVITANYWVITEDTALNDGYSTIQNNITKTSTDPITFEAGKKYNIVVNLGINSVDFAVTEVTDWDSQTAADYHLPQNAS